MLFIFISGASASGKSTIALQLFHNLRQQNIATETLSMDDFYERKANLGNGELNFDKLGFSAIDSELYDSVMTQLAALKMVELPIYSFEHNDRLDTTRSINAAELQVVIVEGIYALHHIPQLEHADTLSFFIEADNYLDYQTQRITRDGNERNRDREEVLKREKRPFGARDAFFTTILPSRIKADFCITNNPTTSLDSVIEEMLAHIMKKLPSSAAPKL